MASAKCSADSRGEQQGNDSDSKAAKDEVGNEVEASFKDVDSSHFRPLSDWVDTDEAIQEKTCGYHCQPLHRVCVNAVMSSDTRNEIVSTNSVRTSDAADQRRRPTTKREKSGGGSSKLFVKGCPDGERRTKRHRFVRTLQEEVGSRCAVWIRREEGREDG